MIKTGQKYKLQIIIYANLLVCIYIYEFSWHLNITLKCDETKAQLYALKTLGVFMCDLLLVLQN